LQYRQDYYAENLIRNEYGHFWKSIVNFTNLPTMKINIEFNHNGI